MKLQSKLIVFLLPIMLIPLGVLGTIAYLQISKNYTASNFEKISNILDQTTDLYSLKINTAKANLQLFSEAKLLEKYVLTEDEKNRNTILYGPLMRLFADYQKAYPTYYEIRIIDPLGKEKVRQIYRDIETKNKEEKSILIDIILADINEFHIDAKTNPDNGELALYISKRLMLKNRTLTLRQPPKLRGFLVLTISLDSLIQQIDRASLGDSGLLFITDEEGNILHFPASRSSTDIFTHNVIEKGSRFKQGILEELTSSISSRKMTPLTMGNNTAHITGRALNDSLYLFALQPASELKRLRKDLLSSVFAIMIGATLIMTCLIIVMLRSYVLRPLYQLKEAAKAIGQGELNTQIDIDSEDEIGSLAQSFQQMSLDLQTTNERIRYLAYHDTLTELPNRNMFRHYLTRAASGAKRKNRSLALLFLDLDNFKWVNDTLGHESGDDLLVEVSNRLKGIIRDSDYIANGHQPQAEDIVARLGGDEFIVLLNDIEDKFAPGHVADRIIESMGERIKLGPQEVNVSFSIGITLYPEDAQNADDLIKNADIAMYHAKKKGKNNYQYFSSSMNQAVSRRIMLENRLRKALNENELSLVYQPQVDIAANRIVGVEALLRWNDPEHGVISPVDFIPVAEESGLILPIGEWVLREACRQIQQWKNENLPIVKVSINVSSIQFSRAELLDMISSALNDFDVSPHTLEIELTESIFIHDEQNATKVLAQIRALGIDVSLDDFGTGYSSLSYLRKFPIDCIKIDRSFISEISQSKEGEAVIKAIISMAHAMNLRVIAEGVETKDQLAFLKDSQCDCAQGYYFYKPAPAEIVTKILSGQLST